MVHSFPQMAAIARVETSIQKLYLNLLQEGQRPNYSGHLPLLSQEQQEAESEWSRKDSKWKSHKDTSVLQAAIDMLCLSTCTLTFFIQIVFLFSLKA